MKKNLILCSTVFLLLFVNLGLAASDYEKGSFYIGFGIGSGDAKITPDGRSSFTFSGNSPDSRLAWNFGAGGIINPYVNLGLELSSLRATWKDQVYQSELSYYITNVLLACTIFPMEKGFYVKAGAGVGIYGFDWTIGTTKYEDSVAGLALLIGVGYFFDFGGVFNVGIGFDYSTQSYNDDTKFKGTSNMFNVFINLYWF